MYVLFTMLFSWLGSIFEGLCNEAAKGIQRKDPVRVIVNILLVILLIVGITLGALALAALAMRFWEWLVIPVILLALITHYAKKDPQPVQAPQAPAEAVDRVRTRAQNTYPTMRQTAYLLFQELCHYLSGLVSPFSLKSVEAPVFFDITAAMVVHYYFIIAKGDNESSTETMREILENIILQHLRAQDLPISIPAIYTAADGSTWPGLVVHHISDFPNYYQVDFVITNEAEVSALKAKGVSRIDAETGIATPHDPDFS